MEIGIPRRPVAVRGKVIWSNLAINSSGTEVSHAGLSIMKIEEEDREWLNKEILRRDHTFSTVHLRQVKSETERIRRDSGEGSADRKSRSERNGSYGSRFWRK
jgi:hypothetical protein